jgi:hypothetical protein
MGHSRLGDASENQKQIKRAGRGQSWNQTTADKRPARFPFRDMMSSV